MAVSKFWRELRFWLLLLLILFLCVPLKDQLLSRLSLAELPGDIDFFLNFRISSMFNNLDKIIHSPNSVALVFGSSEIEGFFDPALLESELAERNLQINAFNMGLRKLHPARFQAVSEKLESEMSVRQARVDYVFVQIPRVRLTRRYRKYAAAELTGHLMPRPTVIQLTDGALRGNLLPLARRYQEMILRGDAGYSFHIWLELRSRLKSQDADPGADANFGLMRRAEFMEYPPWSFARKGLYTFNLPYSKVAYQRAVERMKSQLGLDWAEAFYRSCSDIFASDFDPESLAEMRSGLTHLSHIASHVIIFNLPETPVVFREHSESSKAAMKQMMADLSSATGAVQLDTLEGIAWQDSDFRDIEHLSPAGARKLAAAMADQVIQVQDKRN